MMIYIFKSLLREEMEISVLSEEKMLDTIALKTCSFVYLSYL